MRRLTKLQFAELLGDDYVTILSAAKQSPVVDAWYQKFLMSSVEPDGTSIDLDDPRTVAGINSLAAAGLMTTARAAQLLSVPSVTQGNPHTLVVDSDTPAAVAFRCTVCGKSCGFNKLDEPKPVANGASWLPPQNYDQWMGPCNN